MRRRHPLRRDHANRADGSTIGATPCRARRQAIAGAAEHRLDWTDVSRAFSTLTAIAALRTRRQRSGPATPARCRQDSIAHLAKTYAGQASDARNAVFGASETGETRSITPNPATNPSATEHAAANTLTAIQVARRSLWPVVLSTSACARSSCMRPTAAGASLGVRRSESPARRAPGQPSTRA